MIYKKSLYIFLFFLIQIFNLNAYGESKKDNKIINSTYKLRKNYFPTTQIKGNLFFTLGALYDSNSSEALHFTYENKFILKTSFKETDNLLTIIESGNASESPLKLDLQSQKGEKLKISTLLYRLNLDDESQLIIGPKMFGYHGLAGKSTAYNERIAILDGTNYTTSSGVGPGVGISKRKKNGFNATVKIASNSSQINNESLHLISQIGLTKKNLGGTITANLNNNFEAYGLATFFEPKNFPSISASIEFKNDYSSKFIKNWVFAFQQNLLNKKIGLALGTYTSEEKLGYELWGDINITDKFKFIPVFFVRENNQAKSELGFSINTRFNY